jgi:hypothetical protein
MVVRHEGAHHLEAPVHPLAQQQQQAHRAELHLARRSGTMLGAANIRNREEYIEELVEEILRQRGDMVARENYR